MSHITVVQTGTFVGGIRERCIVPDRKLELRELLGEWIIDLEDHGFSPQEIDNEMQQVLTIRRELRVRRELMQLDPQL